MNTLALLVAGAVTLPLAAQGLSSPIRPVGALQTIAHNRGLQADRDKGGLVGAGTDYHVHFRDTGVLYEPALGMAAPVTQHFALSAPAVSRGSTTLTLHAAVAPAGHEFVATYARASGVEERFDVRSDGVELSWRFAERPAGDGDLMVRYAIDTSLGEPSAVGGGLLFARDYGGVRIGKVTGVDARGRRVDGRVACDGSGVVFSLPASFVDGAVYPIVLDPVIGTTLAMTFAAGGIHSDPDAAYDATTDHWLVVWLKTFSATDIRVVGQIVSNATGVPLPFSGFLSFSAAAHSPPRVVNHGLRDEFGLVFTQTVTSPTTLHSVELRRVSATSGSLLGGITVESSGSIQFANADVGALVEPPAGSFSGYTVAYESGTSVFARVASFTTSGSLLLSPAFLLWNGNPNVQFRQPAISRAAAADGRLLVAAVRQSGSLYAIVGTELHAGSSTPGVTGTLVLDTANVLSRPDVDGFDGRWFVAWQDAGSGLLLAGVRVLTLTIDPAASTFVLGPGTGFGGTFSNLAFAPRLAYAPGRTWLAYRSGAIGATTSTMRVVALDSNSCANCNDPFSITAPNGSTITVATMTSGGVPQGEDALCAWQDTANGISGQRLRNFGTVGTTTSLGGGCGSTGVVAFNHAPGIGSSGFRCSLHTIPATALAAIFNFSAPSATIPCGACVWTPFVVTQTPPILGGSAFVEFPIPCLTTLVGGQLETQWTLIDLSQAPCPVFPGLALSNRTLLTIGN